MLWPSLARHCSDGAIMAVKPHISGKTVYFTISKINPTANANFTTNFTQISCSVNWELKMDGNRSYIFYMFAMGLFLPTVTIIVSYTNILRVVRNVKREINQRATMRIRIQPQKEKSRRSDAAERRSTVMVAVMIGAFMVAWTPYSILALVEVFSGRRNDSLTSSPGLATIPCLFAKTSTVLNPIIYGFLNTQVKHMLTS